MCLTCRRESRAKADARANRTIVRAGAVLAVAVVTVALGKPVFDTFRGGTTASSSGIAAAGVLGPADFTGERSSLVEPGAGAARSTARLEPIIAEGRTPLQNGIYVVRSGEQVSVHFDTPATRTRRRDKFERVVRATLPVVYGPLADSLLATVPQGRLVRDGDLVTELPARGVHLRTDSGATLALWPETRPGRDGPIVVTYRTTLTRAN